MDVNQHFSDESEPAEHKQNVQILREEEMGNKNVRFHTDMDQGLTFAAGEKFNGPKLNVNSDVVFTPWTVHKNC